MRQIDLLPPGFHADMRCRARRRRSLLCCAGMGAVLATALLALHAGAGPGTAQARPAGTGAHAGRSGVPATPADDHRPTTDDTWVRSKVERHQEFAR